MRRIFTILMLLSVALMNPAFAEPKKEINIGDIDTRFSAVSLQLVYDHPTEGEILINVFGMLYDEKKSTSRQLLQYIRETQKHFKVKFNLFQGDAPVDQEQLRLFHEHNIDTQVVDIPDQLPTEVDQIEALLFQDEEVKELLAESDFVSSKLIDMNETQVSKRDLRRNKIGYALEHKPVKGDLKFAVAVASSIGTITFGITSLNNEVDLATAIALTLFNSGYAGVTAYNSPYIHALAGMDLRRFGKDQKVPFWREAVRRALVLGIPLHFGRLEIMQESSKTAPPIDFDYIGNITETSFLSQQMNLSVEADLWIQNAMNAVANYGETVQTSLDPMGFAQMMSLLLTVEAGSIYYNRKLHHTIPYSDPEMRRKMFAIGLAVGSAFAIMSSTGYGDPTGVSVIGAYVVMAGVLFDDVIGKSRRGVERARKGFDKFTMETYDRIMNSVDLATEGYINWRENFKAFTKAMGYNITEPLHALGNNCSLLLKRIRKKK